MSQQSCPLCLGNAHSDEPSAKPSVLFSNERWRVVDAQEPVFPCFTRVIWRDHVSEMTDLAPQWRQELMMVVFEVESVMRQVLSPNKINLASLGNQVPHLHWHIIARWHDDSAFPQSVWTPPSQTSAAAKLSRDRRELIKSRLPEYHQTLINRLQLLFP